MKYPNFGTYKVHITKNFYNVYLNRNDKETIYEYAENNVNTSEKSRFITLVTEVDECLKVYKDKLSGSNKKELTKESPKAREAFILQYGNSGIVSCYFGGVDHYPGIRGLFPVYVCQKGNKYYKATGQGFGDGNEIGNFYEISEDEFYERRTIEE